MMEWTDRHYRYAMRLLTKRTLLYTEMITAAAIIHGDRDRLLTFDPVERPLSLQLGGDDPSALARAVQIAESYGYDEFNLNVGCPSERVQTGNFGACLMAEPGRVAEIAAAMRAATNKPVTVKHRIGINGRESYAEMLEFVDTVAAAGVSRFTVHARIAVLGGLDPKQNRSVPPLRYSDVYRLKEERPQLWIEINGGVKTFSEIDEHLRHVDAVMLGRAAYETPYLFSEMDARYFGSTAPPPSRAEVVESLLQYAARLEADGQSVRRLTNHILGLFAGRPGARNWKRALSGRLVGDGVTILRRALAGVPPTVADERGLRVP